MLIKVTDYKNFDMSNTMNIQARAFELSDIFIFKDANGYGVTLQGNRTEQWARAQRMTNQEAMNLYNKVCDAWAKGCVILDISL